MHDRLRDDDTVMSLVDRALAQAYDRRESYLRSQCGGDSELFDEAMSYVQWEQRMDGFLLDPFYRDIDQEHPFAPGDLLEGRFRILREVAEGGMGIVYEALDEKLDRRIAIKCAKQGFGGRLPPEVRNASNVSHPNVCKIFEIHTSSAGGREIDFITMEFLDGETLADRLRKGRPAEDQALAIAQQICAGLAEAHRSEVVHGDLKSSNVILTEDSSGGLRAVITDFGLAHGHQAPQESSRSGEVIGTPDYMAPELLRGGKASVATDIYAMGVILHELALGRRPDSRGAAVIAARSELGRNGRRHPRWERIVLRCLEGDPSRRFTKVDSISQLLAVPVSRRWIVRSVALSILTFAATAGSIAYFAARQANSIPSIAVLPFVNEGGGTETGYLSAGVSESLINTLALLPDLKVIARSSAFRFKSDDLDLREIARKLGVKAVVTGRISVQGSKLTIKAELVRADDGTQIWGEQYTPGMSDLTAVQAQISRQIAQRVRSHLTQTDRANIEKETTAHPEAYEKVLRARYQMGLYTPESKQEAVSYYQQALGIDPQYALAHAELASAYRLLGGSATADAAEMMPKAQSSAMRALAIDPELATAHAALAAVKKDRWDWAGAEQSYRRALALNPNLTTARFEYAIYLGVAGRHEEAAAEIKRAIELDPVGLPTAIHAAAVAYNARQYAAALSELKRAVDLDPAAPAPWTWLGIVHGALGDFDAAIKNYDQGVRFGDDTAATQCYLAYSLARSGQRERAIRILTRVSRPGLFVPPSALAIGYTGLNQTERAIAALETGYRGKDPMLQYLKVEPHFDSLAGDARFQSLTRRIGLPQ
jgi:eukaryotic-like serine/threonine-protein kinase